jgi:hypothetical protein
MNMDIRQEFEAWWDKDDLTNSGPWAPNTPIQWAWDAYQAGRRAGAEDMRERAAKWISFERADRPAHGWEFSAAIRALPVEE